MKARKHRPVAQTRIPLPLFKRSPSCMITQWVEAYKNFCRQEENTFGEKVDRSYIIREDKRRQKEERDRDKRRRRSDKMKAKD